VRYLVAMKVAAKGKMQVDEWEMLMGDLLVDN
jgi:hypothetical protein